MINIGDIVTIKGKNKTKGKVIDIKTNKKGLITSYQY